MRALRDFNLPKIITHDVQIIMGLIGDLFPALNVPRKRDMEFEECVKKSVVDLGLQAEDSFVLKVVQLEELRHVRHSIFVIGEAGTGENSRIVVFIAMKFRLLYHLSTSFSLRQPYIHIVNQGTCSMC